MIKEKKVPIIFNYLVLSEYLKDYYAYRKSNGHGFSYEKWIQELDISLSRVFLRLAVLGMKKPPQIFIDSFARNSLETLKEKEYFYLLVKHTIATTSSDKQLFAQKMIQILRTNIQYKMIDDYSDFVSDPLFARLLTLLSFADIKNTEKSTSMLLGITTAEAKAALEKLCTLTLAVSEEINGEKVWKSVNAKNKVTDHHGDMNLMEFHKKSLFDAIKAFEQPKNLRKYQSMLLPLSSEDLKKFYSHLDIFISEQFAHFSSDCYQGKRLFQFNFNIYPVTRSDDDQLNDSSRSVEFL